MPPPHPRTTRRPPPLPSRPWQIQTREESPHVAIPLNTIKVPALTAHPSSRTTEPVKAPPSSPSPARTCTCVPARHRQRPGQPLALPAAPISAAPAPSPAPPRVPPSLALLSVRLSSHPSRLLPRRRALASVPPAPARGSALRTRGGPAGQRPLSRAAGVPHPSLAGPARRPPARKQQPPAGPPGSPSIRAASVEAVRPPTQKGRTRTRHGAPSRCTLPC